MQPLSRRRFLRAGGAAGAAVGLSPLIRAWPALGADASPTALASRTLDWWNPHGSPDFMAQWDILLGEFKSETGIDVVNSIVGWGDLVPRLTQAGVSGTLPGVATGGSGFAQIFASQGILESADDTIAAIEASGSHFTEKGMLGASYNGTAYAVPRYGATNGITFRGDLLEAAGIVPPDPTGDPYAFGWDEFVEVCSKLTKAPDQYAFAAAGTTFDAEKVIWNYLATNEAYIFDENGELIWESDKTVEAYRYVADLFRRFAPPGAVSYDLAAANLAFMNGKVAMTYGDGDVHADVESSGPEWAGRVGFMPSPVKTVKAGYGGNATYLMPKSEQFPEAQEFVKFMMRPDNLARAIWPFRILVIPATDAARNSEILTSDPTFQKWATVLAQMAAVSANASGVAQYFAATPEAGSIEASGILSKTLQNILVNNVDPEQAVADATADLEDVIAG
jgi:ABC-type glycerol-3-phosphate transport system substrate-binding protein